MKINAASRLKAGVSEVAMAMTGFMRLLGIKKFKVFSEDGDYIAVTFNISQVLSVLQKLTKQYGRPQRENRTDLMIFVWALGKKRLKLSHAPKGATEAKLELWN